MHGQGKIIYKDGRILHATFENGVKQGWAKLHIMKKIIEKLYLDDNVIKEISLNNKYYENLEQCSKIINEDLRSCDQINESKN